mmetsp:Transcript_86463/g.231688  ORF Transcript_86463/g.231688 Transcript_86463/m.231688 type:complete len:563 (-) Transcript_86463:240-1928(-)
MSEHIDAATERRVVSNLMHTAAEELSPARRRVLRMVGSERAAMLERHSCLKFCLSIVSNDNFDRLMNFFIVANAICMGVEADSEMYPQSTMNVLLIFEDVFLVIFTIELLLRIVVVGKTFLLSLWGLFDSFVVTTGILAAILFPVLNLPESFSVVLGFRTLRLLRVARALRMVPNLRIMYMLIRGLSSSMQTLVWAAFLMLAVNYTFAIIAVEGVYALHVGTFDHVEELSDERLFELFGTVPRSMLTLLQITSQDSWASFVRPMVVEHWYLSLYFFPFYGIMIMVVNNLITAIIVETSLDTAKADRETERMHNIKDTQRKLQDVEKAISKADGDCSGTVTKDEMMEAYMGDPIVRMKVDGVIDVGELLDLFDIFDDDGDGSLTLEEFRHNFMEYRLDPVKSLMFRALRMLCFIEHNVAALVGHSIVQSRAAFKEDRKEEPLRRCLTKVVAEPDPNKLGVPTAPARAPSKSNVDVEHLAMHQEQLFQQHNTLEAKIQELGTAMGQGLGALRQEVEALRSGRVLGKNQSVWRSSAGLVHPAGMRPDHPSAWCKPECCTPGVAES